MFRLQKDDVGGAMSELSKGRLHFHPMLFAVFGVPFISNVSLSLNLSSHCSFLIKVPSIETYFNS